MNKTGAGSERQRWQKGQSGNAYGVKATYIRKILRERNPEGQQARERIVRHLIELATSYTVIVAGRNLELASGRDSVEAAKLLMAYDMGTPPKMEKLLPAVPIGPGQSLLEIAMNIYRQRLETGQMTEPELAEMVRLLLAAEKDKALIFLKALGSKLQTLQAKQLEQVLGAYEKDPAGFLGFAQARVAELDGLEDQPATNGPESAANASTSTQAPPAFGAGSTVETAEAKHGSTTGIGAAGGGIFSQTDEEDD